MPRWRGRRPPPALRGSRAVAFVDFAAWVSTLTPSPFDAAHTAAFRSERFAVFDALNFR